MILKALVMSVSMTVNRLLHELHRLHLLTDNLLHLLRHLDRYLVAGLLGDLPADLLGDVVALGDGLLVRHLNTERLTVSKWSNSSRNTKKIFSIGFNWSLTL